LPIRIYTVFFDRSVAQLVGQSIIKPTVMSQFINLQQAIDMTTLYRAEKENILALAYKGNKILATCETFDRAGVDDVLAQTDCVKLRIYYGMDESLKVHAIIVGVNSADEDILPSSVALASVTNGGSTGILENAQRCPDDCPPSSSLNP
jgi:hypothetical protein